MENKTNQGTKVVTGKVRFSYVNVFEPRSVNGGDARYSISLIIDKCDAKTISDINSAILQAEKDGISKFGGKIPDNLKLPLRDGDIDRSGDDAYKNSYFVNANSMDKPHIVDKGLLPILEENEVYSGCYGRASIIFYAFNQKGSKGIACGLQNLQKICDGEPLSIRSSAEDDFTQNNDAFLS